MRDKLLLRINKPGLEKCNCCNGQMGTTDAAQGEFQPLSLHRLPQGTSAAAAPTRSMLLIVRKIIQDSTEPPINDACQQKVSLSAMLKVNINIKCNNLE